MELKEQDFAAAARHRWQKLGAELQADVAEFNSRQSGGDFGQPAFNQFRVSNLSTGVELTITADFESRIIRYDYAQVSDKSAGTPEGGMLSMRRSEPEAVEFYSADERLTAEETRKILVEPVLFPPEMAA